MPRRRITRALGAAAGGLLGVAFIPAAAAFADDWTVAPDPTSTETITGLYGHGFSGGDTAPPAVTGSIQGEQIFDYTDTTNSDTGTFYGFESTSNDGLGDINSEVYVAPTPDTGPYSDVGGVGAPSVGSVFDTYSFDDGAYANVYSDVGGTVTDTLESSSGDVSIPTTFDAANGAIADADGVSIGNGDEIVPLGNQAVNAINGIPPLTVALQGTQTFDVDDGDDTLGQFPAVDTTTTDGFGTYTEAVLATASDTSNTVGDGSIFNTITLGDDSLVYSDLVSPSGDVVTDTLETPFGDSDVPVTFDAAQAETVSQTPIDLPDGYDFTSASPLDYTGINGLPPVDVGVQGTQDFDYTDGASSGSFTADVTNTLDAFNDSTEAILVTSSTGGDLPVGSEFEIVNFGNGFESLYSDIASTTPGGDTISETLVTPLGDIPLTPSFDAAAGLASDFFSL